MTNLAGIRIIFATMTAAGLVQAQSGTMRPFQIMDPVLQMNAWTLMTPASWKVEGTMMPGSSCDSATSPIFRASSADGLTGVYFLPRFDWSWGAMPYSGKDCLPFHEAMSAKDFLTYLTRILQVGFVQEEVVPELAEARRNTEEANRQYRGTMQSKIDMARYLVRYSLDGKPVEEWLSDTVTCTSRTILGVGRQQGCSAFVTRWFAPQGKLQGLNPTFQAMTMNLNQAWMDRWTAVMTQQTQQRSQQQTQAMLEQGRLAQDQRMKQQQQFMTSFQQGSDIRKQRFEEGQYQKRKTTDDFVDHILDCQRLYGDHSRVSVGNNCPNRETY